MLQLNLEDKALQIKIVALQGARLEIRKLGSEHPER